MNTLNLLNLNVDTLFEQHSVAEIDTVHKKILEVVEQKREELRTMVGERYRDLLKAADTITAMQDSTKAIIKEVDHIKSNCKNLNEQQLLGFKMETDNAGELKARNANKQLNNYFSTMIQIKLLTSLPELIWSQLDSEQFYAATELFIFSRHISTGLQLDLKNPIMQKLPVAKKQWEVIKPFHMTIKHQVMAALERENLGPTLTVDCILSLLQLERCTLESVLKTFLNLRCNAYLNCLNAENERVKERVLSSLRVLNESLDMVAKCFLNNGLLFTKLEELSKATSPPSIERMDDDDLQFANLLPDIILKFRPKFDTVAISNEAICSLIHQFLKDIERIAGRQLNQLFGLITHMNIVQEIKTEAMSLRQQLNINSLTAQFQLSQSLDFYELHYVPLINQRIHNIINDSWLKAINETFVCLESSLQQVDAGGNTKCYSLWQEFPSDLPTSLDQALSGDIKKKKLLMKSKGYNSNIIQIATEFDKNLSDIIKEMNILLEEPTSKLEDKQALVEFLRDTAQQHITEFITRVKSIQVTSTDRQSLLLITRICCALIELCPHLQICFSQSTAWRQLLGTTSSTASEHWQRICGLMEKEIYTFWMQLVDGLLGEINCERYLAKIQSFSVILEDFANWEVITLEQKDEEDKPVQSSFRIPTQPSISLQFYLQTLITSLKETVPETLPTKVLESFNHRLIDELIKHYQQLLRDHPSVSQNIALQLYFDIKFLQNSFNVTRDQKEQITITQNAYKELIDPFDFELFSTQLMANIKRAVLRSNCLLGVLTSLNMQLPQPAAVIQEKEPNVLSLCSSGSTSLWFPLLPVVTNTVTSSAATESLENKQVAVNESPKTTPTRKTTSSRKNDTKAKSGAASFFGAMSQDWFR